MKRNLPQAIFQGDQFGRLTVIRKVGRTPGGASLWLCQCSCGNRTRANTGNLRAGRHRSCGCLGRDTHSRSQNGCSNTPTYKVWQSLLTRCSRGYMKMDPRWKTFKLFLTDMGFRPKGCYLTRRDQRWPWTKSNSCWRFGFRQCRSYIGDEVGMTTREAAKVLGISSERARQLYHAGRLLNRLVVRGVQ